MRRVLSGSQAPWLHLDGQSFENNPWREGAMVRYCREPSAAMSSSDEAKPSRRRLTREGTEYQAFIDQDYPSTSQPATGGECLVFRPTWDEFKDFESLLSSLIRHQKRQSID